MFPSDDKGKDRSHSFSSSASSVIGTPQTSNPGSVSGDDACPQHPDDVAYQPMELGGLQVPRSLAILDDYFAGVSRERSEYVAAAALRNENESSSLSGTSGNEITESRPPHDQTGWHQPDGRYRIFRRLPNRPLNEQAHEVISIVRGNWAASEDWERFKTEHERGFERAWLEPDPPIIIGDEHRELMYAKKKLKKQRQAQLNRAKKAEKAAAKAEAAERKAKVAEEAAKEDLAFGKSVADAKAAVKELMDAYRDFNEFFKQYHPWDDFTRRNKQLAKDYLGRNYEATFLQDQDAPKSLSDMKFFARHTRGRAEQIKEALNLYKVTSALICAGGHEPGHSNPSPSPSPTGTGTKTGTETGIETPNGAAGRHD